MVVKVTKASLQADLEAVRKSHDDDMSRLKNEITELKVKLGRSETEARMAKQDSDRHQTNWNDCEKRLAALRQVIEATLQVKHQTGTSDSQEYFRGQMVKEDVSEDVRLLRHLFSLSNNQPPF